MNLHTFYLILQQTLIITTFVIGMMMVIEYVNVRTGGLWSGKLQKSHWMQILIGSVMGIIPGCLGTYVMVSLYVHRVVNFPALMAAFIATTGDEAFFMFSLFPKTALKISLVLFVLSFVTGTILQLFMKNKYVGLGKVMSLPIHENEFCHYHGHHKVKSNFKNITFVRALLITGCVAILALLLSGVINGSHHLNILMGGQTEESVVKSFEGSSKISVPLNSELNEEPTLSMEGSEQIKEEYDEKVIHHNHEGETDWIRYTLILLFFIILIIIIIANDHFLEEHFWEHVIKVHLPKIFFWTFGVIFGLTILNHFVNIQNLITSNPYIVLLIAILIGIIPQSGPHLIFVLLFAQGSLPLSILLASSIVQDGHGALPLLAESRKAFIISKGIKIGLGLITGISGILIGF